MHFKKLRDILKLKTSEIEILLLVCCLRQLAFLVHLMNLKYIICVNLLLFECQSTCYQEAVKVPLQVAPIFAIEVRKKRSNYYKTHTYFG